MVLSPVGKFKPDTLDVAIDIIRNRVDTFGTLEPEITRQGSDIVIDLPGVKDRDKAIALVGKTAELRFRPVLAPVPSEAEQAKAATTTTTTATGRDHHDHRAAADRGRGAGRRSRRATPPPSRRLTRSPPRLAPRTQRDACVVLPDKPGSKTSPRYFLGKAGLTGKGTVSTAKAEFVSGQGWTVKMDLTGSGSSKWDALAQQQFQKQVAIVLDGQVQSAPTIQPRTTGLRRRSAAPR